MSEPIAESNFTNLQQVLSNPYLLMNIARKGLDFDLFNLVIAQSPFTLKEWSAFVQLNERTLQRYRQEKTPLDPIYSERVLGIAQVLKQGESVFGNLENFKVWLDAENIALGDVKPKSLLDSTFGIEIIKDELTRIEHGILA
ncbi:MAG: DUF2384 domain-containing protein [Haliscomenobacteraceae bacterium CHB4]|nr:hypothetical protein [Saprospiraceae bacterium]MCE7921945.1 DUF2384 domain-containing protein [Haliscomenobacteraceae bacterium CHB4]